MIEVFGVYQPELSFCSVLWQDADGPVIALEFFLPTIPKGHWIYKLQIYQYQNALVHDHRVLEMDFDQEKNGMTCYTSILPMQAIETILQDKHAGNTLSKFQDIG